MNPNTLTDQLSLFLDVLETGSFSAAARRHPLTPSAVARRIDSLENSVGSRLFQRSTHAVVPTSAGLAFAERARRIVSELQLARAEAVSLSHAPEGLIRVDAPAAFGRRHLAPVIADFLNLYPGLDVHLHLIDSFVDMQGAHLGKVDLVLRAGHIVDTRLVATPLASIVRIACASPAYLKSRGTPAHPRELSEHDGLDWDGLAPMFAWRFELDGRRTTYRPRRIRMSANNAEALLSGALAGLGIAHLPTWLASEYLVRGELLPLFCEDGLPSPETAGIYALRLEQQPNARSRLLLEYLKSRFSPVPPWDLALQSGLV
ncbi:MULTISPECIES: LysR family transcriptional regulator [Pseudomonas]|uniref:LysR family transcriptional regulator n=2 Tax=Gammaproteobacteria TaxID=1236 RepID=A0A219A1M2_9PSED|nr:MULTISPECIES: LysR family transcriptional regulator [Pseudomonas]MBD8558568.1 LysR family transcriptional regulator [Pseudomonas fluorescens]KRP78337.1 LysR family transcriptional regulator [Pseudomonas lactis]MDI3249224.1 LysR family transcriptional regulator [Pseudomonas sp. AL10]MDI3265252.1 LysR family transcriptional regulator [Pseudomonas sp. AL15]NNA43982.1 LysR family transcriptional regulator [Pseudomonas lactis]